MNGIYEEKKDTMRKDYATNSNLFMHKAYNIIDINYFHYIIAYLPPKSCFYKVDNKFAEMYNKRKKGRFSTL